MEMKQMASKGAGNLGVNSPKDYYGAEDVPLARPGGSVDHDEGAERGDDGETLPPTFQPTFGRKLLIFVTYSCVIFAISSPLASYPAMVKDVPGFGVSSSFFVLGIATAGTGLGKLLPGYLVARFGARRTYFVLIMILGLLCGTLSICNSVGTIAMVQFCIEFTAGPAWPSHNEMVRGHFGTAVLGNGIQTISLASRSSDMVGKVMYGSMLYAGISWRWVARLAAAICAIGAFLSVMHKDSHFKVNVRRDVSLRDIFDRTVNVLRRKRYWIAVCMYMLLTILKKSGQLVPVYFSNTSDPSLVNSGVAAWLGTIFQLGLLLGIFGGGYVYNSVSKTKKRGLVIGLLLLSTGAGVVLTLFGVHVTSSLATLVFRCALVTIFATGVGLAYYIPIGVFVVKIGKEDTATVSALMDIVGYAFGSIFFTFVLTRMVKHLGWFWVWIFYAGVALLSAFLATGFLNMLLETDWDTIEPEYICARKTGAGDDKVSLLDNDQQVL